MWEFVFSEIPARFGHLGEEKNGEARMKKEERNDTDEKADKKKSENKTIIGRMSHNNLSFELSIAQVGANTHIK